MSVLERIAFYQGRRDEVPNQELARELAEEGDEEGAAEMAEHLWDAEQNVRSDCLKVLYELGYMRPEMTAPHAAEFLKLLKDRNNRMVWGAMIGLSNVALVEPEAVWAGIDRVIEVTGKGTVITRVSGVMAMGRVAAASGEYRERLWPVLMEELRGCEPKLLPRHAGDVLPAVDEGNADEFREVLESRMPELSKSQLGRLRKVLRELDG